MDLEDLRACRESSLAQGEWMRQAYSLEAQEAVGVG
jgi:hypothetical protein